MLKFKKIMLIVSLIAFVAGFAVSVSAAGEVNINIASKEELMQLEGVGSAYAMKIIEYREANGPFETPEDIMNVKGIGTSTFEKNKERITVVQAEKDVDDLE
jgi:competence protein ComEA